MHSRKMTRKRRSRNRSMPEPVMNWRTTSSSFIRAMVSPTGRLWKYPRGRFSKCLKVLIPSVRSIRFAVCDNKYVLNALSRISKIEIIIREKTRTSRVDMLLFDKTLSITIINARGDNRPNICTNMDANMHSRSTCQYFIEALKNHEKPKALSSLVCFSAALTEINFASKSEFSCMVTEVALLSPYFCTKYLWLSS